MIKAIIWDYDGTLVDSMHRNLAVSREIMQRIRPEIVDTEWPLALSNVDVYRQSNHSVTSWRELYIKHFGFSEQETDIAGPMWAEHQEKNTTKIDLFTGFHDMMQQLDHVRHGICSQNCSNHIFETLSGLNVQHHFETILGYNDIEFNQQKPNPASFFEVLNKMQIRLKNGDILFYVGDHREDARFAKNTEQALQKMGYDVRIFSIAAGYGGAQPTLWDLDPDFTAQQLLDIPSITQSVLIEA